MTEQDSSFEVYKEQDKSQGLKISESTCVYTAKLQFAVSTKTAICLAFPGMD